MMFPEGGVEPMRLELGNQTYGSKDGEGAGCNSCGFLPVMYETLPHSYVKKGNNNIVDKIAQPLTGHSRVQIFNRYSSLPTSYIRIGCYMQATNLRYTYTCVRHSKER